MSGSQVGAKAPTLLPAGKYKCPKCDNRIQVFVKMTTPPACITHSGGAVQMEKQK